MHLDYFGSCKLTALMARKGMLFPKVLFASVCSLGTLSAATLTSGHLDLLGFKWDGTTIVPHAHVDVGAVVDGTTLTAKTDYAPSDLTVLVSTVAMLNRPTSTAWNPTGVGSGEPIWILPQTQNPNLPWPGLTTEDASLKTQTWTGSTPFSVVLTNATIPAGADFSLFTIGSFGTPTFLMTTSNGISSADRINVPINTHAHYNWAFSDPGTYELTFDFTANHATQGLITESATYTFVVVPEPSSAALGLSAGGLLLFRRKRTR